MKYLNGDTYVGNWVDEQQCGHGKKNTKIRNFIVLKFKKKNTIIFIH